MKKYDILYDFPASEVRRLFDSPEAEQFSDSLADQLQNEFTTLAEETRALGAEILVAKEQGQPFLKWDDLLEKLRLLESKFLSFPRPDSRRLQLHVILARQCSEVLTIQRATEESPLLDEVDIQQDLFEIRELDFNLPFCWFKVERLAAFENSIAVFSCKSMEDLQRAIQGDTLSPSLAFHFMTALAGLTNVPPGYAALVKRTVPSTGAPAVGAFTKLMILSKGELLHEPKVYPRQPLHIADSEILSLDHDYRQWNDIFSVLSEYNSRNELLLKYFTLYTVIENFMFKLPIVELERQKNGEMFSIRDFQELYRRVGDSEIDALRKLITKALPLGAPTKTLQNILIQKWDSILHETTPAAVQHVLGIFKLTANGHAMTHSEFKRAEFPVNLARLVYSVRNSIVHNKETEFHLTYANLEDSIAVIIMKFLIPALEEISFGVIGTPNALVWYQNDKLALF